MSPIRVKICGLKTVEDVRAAIKAGAAYLGFNFFPKSKRYVSPQIARELCLATDPGVAKVGLFVDPEDEEIAAVLAQVPLDMIQLHGHESPERVAEVRTAFGLPVIKAVGIGDEEDLPQLTDYGRVADQLLVDAKPPRDGALTGGNGLTFDWRLIGGRRWPVPWMLAGGLTPENVAEAIRLTGAHQVDTASGVESAPGVKDAERMQVFAAAAFSARQ